MRCDGSFRLAAVATAALLAASASQGQSFSVSVNALDIWSARVALRHSNADSLNGPLFTQPGDDFFVLGTSFSSIAANSGTFRLNHRDVNHGYNFGGVPVEVNALVTAISEPETYALMLAGLGVVGFLATRRHG